MWGFRHSHCKMKGERSCGPGATVETSRHGGGAEEMAWGWSLPLSFKGLTQPNWKNAELILSALPQEASQVLPRVCLKPGYPASECLVTCNACGSWENIKQPILINKELKVKITDLLLCGAAVRSRPLWGRQARKPASLRRCWTVCAKIISVFKPCTSWSAWVTGLKQSRRCVWQLFPSCAGVVTQRLTLVIRPYFSNSATVMKRLIPINSLSFTGFKTIHLYA